MFGWAEVARHFAWDGAWRDIIVPGSSRKDWDLFLQTIKDGPWECSYRRDDEFGIIPASFSEIDDDFAHTMIVKVFGEGLKCHFWTGGDIELDFIPTDVSGQRSLDELSEFCIWLSSAIGKPVRVTEENDPEAAILEYRPNKSAEYLGKELSHG